MSANYLSCAQTAALVRKALKEAFPDIKFSVRSSTYSMGASIGVSWTDGPNENQVEAVTSIFRGSYFDGSIDYKGSVYHMMDGIQVRFGADSIHTNRSFSEAARQAAIDAVYRRNVEHFTAAGIDKPSANDHERGRLWSVYVPGFTDNLASAISCVLHKNTDRLKVAKSKTAAKVFVTHDDGYSKSTGCGITHVDHETL